MPSELQASSELTQTGVSAYVRSPVLSLLASVARRPRGVVALAIVVANFAMFLFGPLLAPYSPTATGVGPALAGPTTEHWLGTDSLGRDVWSRLLTGGGEVFLIPLVAVLIAFLIGGSLGMFAGYRGGWLDTVILGATSVLLSIPSLLIALVVIAGFGASTGTLVAVVAAVYTPRVARIMRSTVRSIRSRAYVLAAEGTGASARKVIGEEIFPNVTGPLLVEFSVRLSYAVILVASLSFLGLGAQPPSSHWGLMIAEGRDVLLTRPAVALAPSIATAILLVGVLLFTDTMAKQLGREAIRVEA